MNDLKKKGLSHENHNQLLTLKSNTMKNTVQRYGCKCTFAKSFVVFLYRLMDIYGEKKNDSEFNCCHSVH